MTRRCRNEERDEEVMGEGEEEDRGKKIHPIEDSVEEGELEGEFDQARLSQSECPHRHSFSHHSCQYQISLFLHYHSGSCSLQLLNP